MNNYKFKDKVCVVCKKSYKPNNGSQLGCSKACQYLHKRTHWNEWGRNYKRRLRKRVLDHYGHKCKCCGETRYEFLALDHVNNDGAAHRRELFPTRQTTTSSSVSLCNWIERNSYPDSIQILCHNCNAAKGFYGYCPHQKEEEQTYDKGTFA